MSLQYEANNSPPVSRNCMRRKHIRWKPPDPHFIKLNFDGAVKSNHNAAAGFVIRDDQGRPILASSKHIGVLVAEAFALIAGLNQAIISHYHHIQAEGNSKILIDSITGKSCIPWLIHDLVRVIHHLATKCSAISFHHIYKEANFVADALATAGHTVSTATWMHISPSSTSHVV